MESERFDRLVRQTYQGVSRRGIVRAGAGALAATTLAALGLGAAGTEARKGKAKKRKLVCHDGQSIRVRNRKKHLRHGDTKGPCPPSPAETCPAERPVTCGDGCCAAEYPLCCPGVDPSGGTCNPADATCCSIAEGGGSCGGFFPVCCPPTTQTPFGWCAEEGGECCTTEEGGYACGPGETCCPQRAGDAPTAGPWCASTARNEVCCPAELGGGFCHQSQVCCPPTPNVNRQHCCPPTAGCCDTNADCPSGFCDLNFGCCFNFGPFTESVETPPARGGGKRSGEERFHMRAS